MLHHWGLVTEISVVASEHPGHWLHLSAHLPMPVASLAALVVAGPLALEPPERPLAGRSALSLGHWYCAHEVHVSHALVACLLGYQQPTQVHRS